MLSSVSIFCIQNLCQTALIEQKSNYFLTFLKGFISQIELQYFLYKGIYNKVWSKAIKTTATQFPSITVILTQKFFITACLFISNGPFY